MNKSDWIEVLNNDGLSFSDYTSIGILFFSLITICFVSYNTGLMKTQVETQIKQWELSNTPVLKVAYLQSFELGTLTLLIENANNVYHIIEGINSSTNEIKIRDYFYGEINHNSPQRNGVARNQTYKGLAIALEINSSATIITSIQLLGKDALGIKFKFKIKDMNFKNMKLDNHLQVANTYLEKL